MNDTNYTCFIYFYKNYFTITICPQKLQLNIITDYTQIVFKQNYKRYVSIIYITECY